MDGEALLHALDRRGFAVSSGSSCTSATLRPSHVLEAMGVLSHGNVRVSLHREYHGAPTWTGSWRCCPAIVSDCGPRRGWL